MANNVEHSLTVLTRLAQQNPPAVRWLEEALNKDVERLAEPAINVAIQTGDPIGPVLARVLERSDGVDLTRLEDKIPYPTTALREVAAAVCRKHWESVSQRAEPWSEDTMREAALAANSLGLRLTDLGRMEEALGATQRAIALYRELTEKDPDRFTPNLALALNNVCVDLANVGRLEEALAAAEEARNLYRELVATRSDAFTSDLAMSLTNLASFLVDLGRRGEGLVAAEEARDLYRGLAAARPDAFTPFLAASLTNLCKSLSKLGRREEALASAQEAQGLYRELATARPDAFTPDLAISLNNLAMSLSELGRREEALAASEEAVRTLGPYFLARPLAFAPWMRIVGATYLEGCEELDRAPDEELLRPIEAALKALEEGDGKGQEPNPGGG